MHLNSVQVALILVGVIFAAMIVAGAIRVAKISPDTSCDYLAKQRGLGIALLVIGSAGITTLSIVAGCKGGFGHMDCGARLNSASAATKRLFL